MPGTTKRSSATTCDEETSWTAHEEYYGRLVSCLGPACRDARFSPGGSGPHAAGVESRNPTVFSVFLHFLRKISADQVRHRRRGFVR